MEFELSEIEISLSAKPDLSALWNTKTLWELQRDFHVKISAHLPGRFEVSFSDRVSEILCGARKIFIAEISLGEEKIGYVIASLKGKTGIIESLFVLEAFRGKQLGSRLMGSALSWLEKHEAEDFKLLVAVGNESALKFYSGFGFEPFLYQLNRKNKNS